MTKRSNKYIKEDCDTCRKCTCGPPIRCPYPRYAQLQLCDSFKAYEASKPLCRKCRYNCCY